jgi:signal transduction histidine kinase
VKLSSHFEIKGVGRAHRPSAGQLTNVRRQEAVVNSEIEYTGSHTSKKILELSTSFVFDASGSIDIIIAQLKDLTEKKAIQTRLEIKEKLSAMGALASGVAHEIRNPLNSINILAQRVQREFHPSERQEDFQKFMQTIRSEVTRVNHIIRQFLEFARPPRLNKTDLSICEVIEECISLVETEARLKDVDFVREFNGDCALSADREKMKQVFINLFRNSLDAMDSGLVKCSVSKNCGMAEIHVSDSGSGIPKDILPRVFNLYFTTKSNGNGLGLSIVHQIVSEHNGSIEVDSIENSGTTVIIRIPLNEQHSVPNN